MRWTCFFATCIHRQSLKTNAIVMISADMSHPSLRLIISNCDKYLKPFSYTYEGLVLQNTGATRMA